MYAREFHYDGIGFRIVIEKVLVLKKPLMEMLEAEEDTSRL